MRHDRSTEQNDDDAQELAVKDGGDQSQFLRADRRHLPGFQRPSPRQKLNRRDDRQQSDCDENRKFCGERATMKMSRGTLMPRVEGIAFIPRSGRLH
jgi:hypothetical protein